MSEKISSLADAVINTLKTKKKVELQELIADVGGDAKDVQSIVAILEEEGLTEIRYNLTKICVVWTGEETPAQHPDGDKYEMLSIPGHRGTFEFKQSNPTSTSSQPQEAQRSPQEDSTQANSGKNTVPNPNAGLNTADDYDDYEEDYEDEVPVKKAEAKKISEEKPAASDRSKDADEIDDEEDQKEAERKELDRLAHKISAMSNTSKDDERNKPAAKTTKTKKSEKRADKTDEALRQDAIRSASSMYANNGDADKANGNSNGNGLFEFENHSAATGVKRLEELNGKPAGSVLDRNILIVVAVCVVVVILVAATMSGMVPFAALGSLFAQGNKTATTTETVASQPAVILQTANVTNHSPDNAITAPRLSAEVQLRVTDSGYAPATIEVQNGTELQVVLSNEGQYAHAFVFDKKNVTLVVNPHDKKSVKFIVDEDGTFLFYSNRTYYDPALMIEDRDKFIGRLVVD